MFLKISILIITFLYHIEAHIRLSFPPSRKFAIDFLDNQRTYGPCGGMPSGDITTQLDSGKSYKIYWQMGLLHQGNFQIELFNSTGKIMDFVTWDETKTLPITTQSRLIEIPKDFSCIGCTLRILREAKEFSGKDNPYIFWSCSDVDIAPPRYENPIADKSQCSGHGIVTSAKEECRCEIGYTGKYCQLTTECYNDSHCGRHGKGRCILREIDEHQVGQCFCEYPYFGEKCSSQDGTAKSLQQFQADLQINLRKYQKIDLLRDQLTLYYKIISRTYILNDSETEPPQIEFVLRSNSTSFLGLGWRPLSLTKECKRQWPNTATKQDEEFRKTHEFEHAPFSAMDCTDMTIFSVRGTHSYIRDYYTMDRSTPQLDTFWGGDDNIISSTGWESSSETTVVVRKAVSSSDTVDHDLSGDLHLIWSRGQTFPPNSNSIYSRFYGPDIIKYHGYGPNQRGVLKVKFA